MDCMDFVAKAKAPGLCVSSSSWFKRCIDWNLEIAQMTVRRSAMLLWQSALLMSQVSAGNWTGVWYGGQHKPSGDVEFPNAKLNLHEDGSGAYENGDGLAFGLTSLLTTGYAWYGSMQGNSNIHCTFDQDAKVFCTWQSPVGDHYFMGSKTPNATSILA